jgi:hypothetical protein
MSLPPLFGKDFPNYCKEYYYNVEVYWYQAEFTQSLYPPGQESKSLIIIQVSFR